MLALFDASAWIALSQEPKPSPDPTVSANPYRVSPQRTPRVDTRVLGVLAAESLLYDALLVAVVASALLVSR